MAERQGSSGAAGAAGRGDDGGVACGRQVHGRPVWALRRRGGASPCACRGVRVNGLGAARTACALKWRGVSGAARQRGGSEAARPRQQRSEAASARALKCLRARTEQRGESQRGRERGEREREWREGEKVSGLTWFKLKIFNGNSKNFEHESCSKLNFLQLSF